MLVVIGTECIGSCKSNYHLGRSCGLIFKREGYYIVYNIHPVTNITIFQEP